MNGRRLVILASAIFLFSRLSAQDSTQKVQVYKSSEWSAQLMGGYLIPHHSDMMAMYRHATGINVKYRSAINQPNGNGANIDKITYGYTFNLLNLGSEVAGYAIGAGGLVMPQSGKYNYWILGMGIGYLTKRYDEFNNPRNPAIGSHLNGMMHLGYHLDVGPYLNKWGWKMYAEAGMVHFSNANWRQPNFGVNIPYLSIGAKRTLFLAGINNKPPQYVNPLRCKSQEIPRNSNWLQGYSHRHSLAKSASWKHIEQIGAIPSRSYVRNQHLVGLRLGRRQIELDQRRTFVNAVLEYNCEFRRALLGPRFRVGANVFFDKSYMYSKFGLKSDAISLHDFTEVAITAGSRWEYGKWGFIADAGIYLYRPDDTKRRYYEGIGVSYKATQRVYVIARLKAHLSSADYMEWGVSYQP
jgi:opacity protein-like surface antigen